MKIVEALNKVINKFNNAGIDSPELDAQILLAFILHTEKYKLLIDYDKEVSKNNIKKLDSLAERRIKSEPIAYITGKKEFYSLEFIITKDVLIPRPETEQLVDLAVSLAEKKSNILDVGTGSGAIAVALKKNRPDLVVHACDISTRALRIAKLNAQKILGDDSIFFLKSDLFSAYRNNTFDLILSNPPYLCSVNKTSIQKEILFEPEYALFAGEQGKEIIERMITGAGEYLKRNGLLILEFGSGQESYLQNIAGKNYSVKIHKDYADLPRIAVLQKLV